jgi:hypothetical protein
MSAVDPSSSARKLFTKRLGYDPASAVLTDIALIRTRSRSRALGAADFVLALRLRASNESGGRPAATATPERAKKLATYLDLVAALRRPPYTASSRSLPPPPSPTP